jgi:SMODS-associating 2TM, beta-strand rich effector domain
MGELVIMHSFSTNSTERKQIPFFIAVLAIGAGVLTSSLFSSLGMPIPWWAPPLDTMTFYGCFYWLFDRFVWKWKIVQALRVSRMPLLAGKWRGRIDPANTDRVSGALASPIDIDITIHQTWLGLLVVGETINSQSRSILGNLLVGDETTVTYEYINEPRVSAPNTMHGHRGTAKLALKNNGTVLEGEYYSGRDRQSFGAIRLKKVGVRRSTA